MSERKYASSQYLTHKHNAYYGCNMNEFTVVLLCVLGLIMVIAIGLGLITLSMFGLFVPGALGGFIFLLLPGFFTAIAIIKKVGKAKEGKQEGYFRLVFDRWMDKHLPMFNSPVYIKRIGSWSSQRNRSKRG